MKIDIAANSQNLRTSIELREDETLLNALNRSKILITQSCAGNATCGTCRVIVEEGLEALTARTEMESEWAAERSFRPEERLSCQTQIADSTKKISILIPD